jgi:hypothetical protein
VVALAMTCHCDGLCYVMYLCRKMIMYYCEDWIVVDLYVLKFELSLYCCVILVTCFRCFSSGEALKTGTIYI